MFKQNGKYGIMPLGDWLDAEMWDHGAEQVCSFTLNAKGCVV